MIKGEHFTTPNKLDQQRKDAAMKRADNMRTKRLTKYRSNTNIQHGTSINNDT